MTRVRCGVCMSVSKDPALSGEAQRWIKAASWNVNSLRMRAQHVRAWILDHQWDVVALQETKVTDDQFPAALFHDLGYHVAFWGQKSYNGVAVASRFPIDHVVRSCFGAHALQDTAAEVALTAGSVPACFDGTTPLYGLSAQDMAVPVIASPPQARYLEVVTGGIRVASVYVPNGRDLGHPYFSYKLAFLQDLEQHLAAFVHRGEATLVMGDFNVALTDRDVHDPDAWRDQLLCTIPERVALRRLCQQGWVDTTCPLGPLTEVRRGQGAWPASQDIHAHPGFTSVGTAASRHPWTWWPYQHNAWARDAGLRIDYVLASPCAADRMYASGVQKDWRDVDSPSDHAPVWVALSA